MSRLIFSHLSKLTADFCSCRMFTSCCFSSSSKEEAEEASRTLGPRQATPLYLHTTSLFHLRYHFILYTSFTFFRSQPPPRSRGMPQPQYDPLSSPPNSGRSTPKVRMSRRLARDTDTNNTIQLNRPFSPVFPFLLLPLLF